MVAIYIHWPFCKKKCPYCDFNSHVPKQELDIVYWINAYKNEIKYYKDYLSNKKIDTIFFGGGTPSTMPIEIFDNIISELKKYANFSSDIEISVEMNPTSIESQKIIDFSKYGANRVSIGIQSFDNNRLKFLGREHNAQEAKSAIDIVNKYFDNYSIDLIYATPEQTIISWEQELNEALSYANKHISLYQLTIEKGTEFFNDYRENKFQMLADDKEIELYNITNNILENNNFKQYEISNYAKHKYECKHNLAYWNYQEYLGIGAGAHSRIRMNNEYYAIMNIHNPEKWSLQSINNKNGVQYKKKLSLNDQLEEYITMNIRLSNGINIKNIEKYFKKEFIDLINKDKLQFMIKDGLIELNEHVKLTQKGKILCNSIIFNLIKN